jgi:hypothetical protein
MTLRNTTTAEVWRNFLETARELRARDQIALVWWTLDDIDVKFDAVCRSFDARAMEPHRPAFRRFALQRISHFLAKDATFNNRVKRELRAWLKQRQDVAPTMSDPGDWRSVVESWSADVVEPDKALPSEPAPRPPD